MRDPELHTYSQLIGAEEYSRQFHQLYSEAKQKKTSFSGSTTGKTKTELQALKEKYRNGVTAEHIKEMVDNL